MHPRTTTSWLGVSLLASCFAFLACDGSVGDDVSGDAEDCSGFAGCPTDDATDGSSGGAPFATPCTPVPGEGGAGGVGGSADGGWIWCEEGYFHRSAAGACPSELPRPDDVYVNDGLVNQCERDSDCTGEHAYCTDPDVEQAPGNVCMNGCVLDSDCSVNQVCDCGSIIGTCVTAYCKTDADCPGEALCVKTTALVQGMPYAQVTILACHEPEDECLSPADCESGEQCYVEAEHRVCRKHGYH